MSEVRLGDVHAHVAQFADRIDNGFTVYAGARDPDQTHAAAWRLLETRDYGGAVALFRQVIAERPDDEDARFGIALSLLQGVRPHRHTEAAVGRIIDHLRCCPTSPHAALLALILEEDHRLVWRRVRSARVPAPTRKVVASVAEVPGRAILRHCPAPEARSWKALDANLRARSEARG